MHIHTTKKQLLETRIKSIDTTDFFFFSCSKTQSQKIKKNNHLNISIKIENKQGHHETILVRFKRTDTHINTLNRPHQYIAR